jgi:hypothetical protein
VIDGVCDGRHDHSQEHKEQRADKANELYEGRGQVTNDKANAYDNFPDEQFHPKSLPLLFIKRSRRQLALRS